MDFNQDPEGQLIIHHLETLIKSAQSSEVNIEGMLLAIFFNISTVTMSNCVESEYTPIQVGLKIANALVDTYTQLMETIGDAESFKKSKMH
jgi:hypothetical protein